MKYAAKTYIGIPYKRLVTPGEILTEEEASALDIPGMLERGAVVEVPRGKTSLSPAETSLSPAGDISPFRGEGNAPADTHQGDPEGVKDGPEGGPGGDRKAPRNEPDGNPAKESAEGGQGGDRKAPRKKTAKKPAPAPDEKPVTQEAALSALTLDDRDMEESPAPAKKGGRKR